MFLSCKYIFQNDKTEWQKDTSASLLHCRITDSEFEQDVSVTRHNPIDEYQRRNRDHTAIIFAEAVIKTYIEKDLDVIRNLLLLNIWMHKRYLWPIKLILEWQGSISTSRSIRAHHGALKKLTDKYMVCI